MTLASVVFDSDKAGSARLIGKFANGSPEWHEVRARGIGGSDVGTIVGCNPWQSAYYLAAVRLGKIDGTIAQNEAMEWGTRLEPVILDKFADEHPELALFREVGTWSHPDREWQHANPDALFQTADGDFGIVEVKTARYEDDWKEGVPAYYRTQVQWYLQTFGYSKAYVVALFSGSRYREFEVIADEFEQDTNLAAVEQWRKTVEAGELPDFSEPMLSTYQATREQHPEIDSEAEVELGHLGVVYWQAMQDLAQAESHANELRARVMDAMGTAKRGLVEGHLLVTRQARNGGAPYLVNAKK